AGEPAAEQRAAFVDLEIRNELLRQLLVVAEGKLLRRRLEEEVERVDDPQVSDQVDLQPELGGLFRKHETRNVVAERILLPVDEVLARRHGQREGQDRRPAVRRRAQAYKLRSDRDRAVVAVARYMIQVDMNTHRGPLRRTELPQRRPAAGVADRTHTHPPGAQP